mmetsp:Transcript_2042/g.4085  ORF Transcript_2042/g.4085 Transcript_2042/m.4085 type:complete len:123 (+) Transcript_2042:2323-2691(+)
MEEYSQVLLLREQQKYSWLALGCAAIFDAPSAPMTEPVEDMSGVTIKLTNWCEINTFNVIGLIALHSMLLVFQTKTQIYFFQIPIPNCALIFKHPSVHSIGLQFLSSSGTEASAFRYDVKTH